MVFGLTFPLDPLEEEYHSSGSPAAGRWAGGAADPILLQWVQWGSRAKNHR